LRSIYFIVFIGSVFFLNDAIAVTIPAGGLVVNDKAEETIDIRQVASDKAQEFVGDAERSKNHAAALLIEKTPDKNLANRASTENFSVSPTPVIRQEFANKMPVTKAVDYPQAEFGMPASEYAYTDEKVAYKNLLEQVRFGLGEGVYSKLIWTYYDLKDLDDRIYSSLTGFDLSGAGFLGKLPAFVGVNDQINALIVLGHGNRVAGLENGDNKSPGGKVVLDFSAQNLVGDNDAKSEEVRLFFKYFSIKNIVYVLLSVLGFGLLRRIFKFFVKQDLS